MTARLQYILGDVTKAREEVIIHGVNCQGVFNAGVAKAIRKEFPLAYRGYIENYEKYDLGCIHVDADNKTTIIHCFTQKYYGRDTSKVYVNYQAVRMCLKNVYDFCVVCKIKEVAMPKIGAGLAGGKWSIIEDYVIDELVNKGIDVNVYVN